MENLDIKSEQIHFPGVIGIFDNSVHEPWVALNIMMKCTRAHPSIYSEGNRIGFIPLLRRYTESFVRKGTDLFSF